MTREERNNIEKAEVKKIFDFITNNVFDINNKQHVSYIEDALTRMFTLEVEQMGLRFDPSLDDEHNDAILRIINDKNFGLRGRCVVDRVKNEQGVYETTKPEFIYNWNDFLGFLGDYHTETRQNGCRDLIKVFYHELQHCKQFFMGMTNVSNKDSLMFARDYVFMEYFERTFYSDSSKNNLGNYYNYSLEGNANSTGLSKFLEYTGYKNEDVNWLIDIERGKTSVGTYEASNYSLDGSEYYDSNGQELRDKISVELLDDIICNKKRLEYLEMYPILQKEYNLDGTKKSIVELVKNLNSEQIELSLIEGISTEEKAELLHDCKEMYYELIERQLEKSNPSQINEIISLYGEEYFKQLMSSMREYFTNEQDSKVKDNEKYYSALIAKNAKYNNTRLPGQRFKYKSYVEMEVDGKRVKLPIEFFGDLLDQDKKKETLELEGKEISLEDFVKKMKDTIPPSGKYVLKDNTIVSAKDFFESIILSQKKFDKHQDFIDFLKDTIQYEDQAEMIINQKRIEDYYSGKLETIKRFEQLDLGEIESDNTQYDFLASLNQSLLKQDIILPNGNKINARQYIQEFVVPRIPESGTFKLKNGNELSARQYIEEFVMFELEKYNGDLDALMQETLAGTDEPPERDPDDKDGQGLGLRQEQGPKVEHDIPKTSRETTSFEDSLETDSEEPKSKKTNSESFRESLATKRKEHRTGHQDVNRAKNIIALRRERDRLSRGENLTEEQVNRLNEINGILAGQQGQMKSNGITR